VMILSTHPKAAPSWHQGLEAIVGADQKQRDSVWAMVAIAFASLADPQVLDAVSPGPGEQFDPLAFLRQRGTVFLVGTSTGASATAGLVGAFVEDVAEAARRLAAACPGARIDPPLSMILDEAANYPLPSLPSLMSEGGGTGITTMVVLQSLAQARAVWGNMRLRRSGTRPASSSSSAAAPTPETSKTCPSSSANETNSRTRRRSAPTAAARTPRACVRSRSWTPPGCGCCRSGPLS
jgi:type IV secretory pathway TraG/TraD family ATPase VirD4